jgi:hypothetical protein
MAERRQGFIERHWSDTLIAAAALFVSAVSLWIGIRTEKANEQLVAASTWPYLLVESSNANPDGAKVIHMDVTNSGVGPAKVETFEVFWNGTPYPSADRMIGDCCGFRFRDPEAVKRTPILQGGVEGTVIRAGETRNFLTLPRTDDDAQIWSVLNLARQRMTYRICYCSVFDECWIGTFGGILPLAKQLRPERVKVCPAPRMAFLQ